MPDVVVTTEPRACADCAARAVVGLGLPAVWYCQDHFDAHLASMRTTLDRFTHPTSQGDR